MRKGLSAVLLPPLLLALAGCGGAGQDAPVAAAEGALLVYTVNYPLAYFAQRIGGDRVRVEFPAPRDVDPAFWSPGADVVSAYQEADLILLNGAGYAGWVEKVTLPATKMVNTSAALPDGYVVEDGVTTHSHGPGGEHSHGEIAFTTWLDLEVAVGQARAIRDAFVAARPDSQAVFDEGITSLEKDLVALDERLRTLIGHQFRKPVLGSHPVYQYLARRYVLDLRMVHFEPDEMPGEDQWKELEAVLAERPSRWMLWEAEPLPETVERLRTLGVESVVYDPCGNVPDEGDFLSVMRENAEDLEIVYSPAE